MLVWSFHVAYIGTLLVPACRRVDPLDCTQSSEIDLEAPLHCR